MNTGTAAMILGPAVHFLFCGGGDLLTKPFWEARAAEVQAYLDSGKSYMELAEIYGVSYGGFRARVAELRKKGLIQQSTEPTTPEEIEVESKQKLGYKESLEIGHDGTHKSDKLLRMSAEQAKDVDYLLDAHGYDKAVWELISAKNNIWNVYSKQDGIQTLYSSKITVRPKEHKVTDKDWQEFFINLSKKYKSPIHTPSNYSKYGKMLEVNIADLHLGKLCWNGDSGDHYDEKVAKERFFYIINDVITRLKGFTFEQILFVWSNDFFHFDGTSKTTTNGTPQDTNLQFENMFELGAEMLIKGIDILSQLAPVTTMYVASNHDRLISFFTTQYLHAWYRNNQEITVDNRAIARKAVRFGNCLIGFTHGNLEKKRIGSWLQVEHAREWGETIFREVHAAHIHSEKLVDEDNGQIIRYVSSPTGTDKWHHNSAYVGAIQKAQSFLWDRNNGLEMVINTPVNKERVIKDGSLSVL